MTELHTLRKAEQGWTNVVRADLTAEDVVVLDHGD
jgi:hypothetical protein